MDRALRARLPPDTAAARLCDAMEVCCSPRDQFLALLLLLQRAADGRMDGSDGGWWSLHSNTKLPSIPHSDRLVAGCCYDRTGAAAGWLTTAVSNPTAPTLTIPPYISPHSTHTGQARSLARATLTNRAQLSDQLFVQRRRKRERLSAALPPFHCLPHCPHCRNLAPPLFPPPTVAVPLC